MKTGALRTNDVDSDEITDFDREFLFTSGSGELRARGIRERITIPPMAPKTREALCRRR